MSRDLWPKARLMGGAAVLAFVVGRTGTGPFLNGLRSVDAWSLAVAAGVAVPTTVSCAWRWRLVARGLGDDIPLRAAVAAYYRSQFLNTTLPGGVLGDVDRGLRQGRQGGDAGRGLRTVALERLAGQLVQVVLVGVVLVLLPSPLRSSMPLVGAVAGVALLTATLLLRGLPRGGSSLAVRAVRAAASDLHDGVLTRRAWPRIALASAAAVAGHAITFLVAARAAGATVSPLQMLPLALLVLLAMGIPANVAGWGPREGVAAWAFSAAGLSADQGVTTSVVYGVMVLVASLPGAAVLVVARSRQGSPAPRTPDPAQEDPVCADQAPSASDLEGAPRA